MVARWKWVTGAGAGLVLGSAAFMVATLVIADEAAPGDDGSDTAAPATSPEPTAGGGGDDAGQPGGDDVGEHDPALAGSAATSMFDGVTFRDAFDGAPSEPRPWNPPDWDVSVHSREVDTWGDGDLEPMEAQHGPACESPVVEPGTHVVQTYAGAVFQCRDHMMTAINSSAYGAVYVTPAAMVDFTDGEAVIRIDVSTFRSSTRDWWDIWISPFEDHVQLPLHESMPDLSGPPRRGLLIEMDQYEGASVFKTSLIEDFEMIEVPGEWWVGYETVLEPDKSRRDTFELRISTDHIRFGLPEHGLWWVDEPIPELDWSVGVVQFGHHSYTPWKDGGGGPNTWHWDNVEIAPAVPFTMVGTDRRFVDAEHDPSTVTLAAPAPAEAMLRFAGIGERLEVSFDGGAWQPAATQAHGSEFVEEAFRSYWMPIPPGTREVSFRGEDWFGGSWRARDISVWSEVAPASSL